MQDEFKKLKEEIIACTACPLASTATNKVIIRGKQPVGNGTSPYIVFCGEAPGAEEDQTGKPFVGRAGQLLQEAIDEAGLQSYAIINILKCRPPENRRPLPEEIFACKKFIDRQINLLNPKFIVPLGDTALKFFMPESDSITKEAGKLTQAENGDNFFPIPHPAYYIRNQSLIPQFKNYIMLLKKKVDEILHPPEEKEMVDYPSVNLQKTENEGKFEMISPQLAGIHLLAKQAKLDFKDINQKDICLLDGKRTYVKHFEQSNEIDIFREELDTKLKDI